MRSLKILNFPYTVNTCYIFTEAIKQH